MSHLITLLEELGTLMEARSQRPKLNKTEQKILKKLLDPARGYYTAEAWSYNGPRSRSGTRGGDRDYNACKSLVDKGVAVLRSADGYRVPRDPGYMAHVRSISIELAPGAKKLLGLEEAAGLMKYTGATWDVQRAAKELQRFDFIATFVARMTRRKADRALVNGMQVKQVKGKWVYGYPPELWNPPARDAAALYDTIRRTPLNHYVRQAEDLRAEALSEASQMGLDFAEKTSKRQPAKPRRTRGKGGLDPDTIVKILDVVDTREYEEVADGVFKPVRGSGTESFCSRCGRPHEVHATVELADKRTAVVGTTCMKGSSLAKAVKAGANTAKAIAKLEAELEHKRELAKKYATVKAQVDKMRPPPVEVKTSSGKYGTNWMVSAGDAYVYSRRKTAKEALKEVGQAVEREWRRNRMNERGATYKAAAAKEWVEVLEKKLKAKRKALETLLSRRA